MGYALSWLAIRGKSREQVHRDLGIDSTGVYDESPEAPFTGARLQNNWYLLLRNRGVFSDARIMELLSIKGEVIYCSIEEHVMVSEASGWRDGRKIWSVVHEAQKASGHLKITGEPPPEFALIRERLQAEQATGEGGVDYIFDVPIEVARAISGYRHDATIPSVDNLGFEILQQGEAPTKTSWLPRWLAR